MNIINLFVFVHLLYVTFWEGVWCWLDGGGTGDTYVPQSASLIQPSNRTSCSCNPQPTHTHTLTQTHAHNSQTCTHISPSTQSRLLHVPSSLKPLLNLLLSCPLFSSWWQNEFAYFSQGALIRMHKPAASSPHEQAIAFCCGISWCKMRHRLAASQADMWPESGLWLAFGISSPFPFLIQG